LTKPFFYDIVHSESEVNTLDNIGERIGMLIEALGMKKVRFAERLKIDQSYVTQLTSGKRNPSDRTISDICREFNVREEWLRNGSGKMFLDFTEDEFAKAAATLSNDIFVRSMIIEYWKLDEDSKKLFRNFIHKLSDSMKEQELTATNTVLQETSATSEPLKNNSDELYDKEINFSNMSIDEQVELYRMELEKEKRAKEELEVLQKSG